MSRRGGGLTISGVHKSFGSHQVLAGADLDVPPGQLTAILGSSGSGKTTLLRVVAGFERADGGTVTVDGEVVEGDDRHLPPERRHIGYVPQEGALFPHLDVAANIGFGLPRAQRRRRVDELLDLIGLGDLQHRYPHELSGGQQQRVALARALATRPAMVLLDEPFSSLDAALRSSVREDVARVLAESGTTTVLVTHDQDEALSMADQVAVLRNGVVAQTGPPEHVYGQPTDPALASFVGEANLLAGTVRGTRVETPLGVLPLSEPAGGRRVADGTAAVVLVRPEQLQLVAAGRSDGSGLPAGVVRRSAYHGHDTVVTVDVDGLPAPVSVRLAGAVQPPGTPVSLRVCGAVVAWPAGRDHDRG
ncbi:MAG TPA: ABC transporter ATP-binding protein [Acidimicrobiales bacterium]|nr:ABC transporter ATP-binding protein [Acidimicrobiales bacterium]